MSVRAPRRNLRTRYTVAAALCALAVIAVIVLGVILSENVVYFRTVSEAVRERKSDSAHRLRMAGAVVPGTVHETASGVRFEMTDGKRTAKVVHDGDPPQLFKAGAPVVCEGRWGANATFDSDRIMIKHGASYTPPKVKT